MKIRIIALLLLTFVDHASFVNGEQIANTIINNDRDSHEISPKIHKNLRGKVRSNDVQPNTKMGLMLLQSDSENHDDQMENRDDSNKKILKFGKRVFESVKRHGIIIKDARLLKMGKYHIDWWKDDRRLQRIRKRLFDELARKPELKNRLHTLGWRNTSEKIFDEGNIHYDHTIVKKPANYTSNDTSNVPFYRKIMTVIESLLKISTTRVREKTSTREPKIFVNMEITLSFGKNDQNDVEKAVNEPPDSPTKFSLNTYELRDFENPGGSTREPKTFNGDDSSASSTNSKGESIDADRLLQLIPLIVDELRNDRMADDERRALSWIFGKRLWQLFEREASKRTGETMDEDLAMFLVKGELVERDPEMARRRRRRQKRSALFGEEAIKRKIARSVVAENEETKKRDSPRDFDDDDESTYGWSASRNFDHDDEKSDETSVYELIDLAAKYEFKKLEQMRREDERKMKKKMKKKWIDDDSDDDYENYD